MNILYDASALFNLIMNKADLTYFEGGSISELTQFEVGNVIWKSYRRKLIAKDEAQTLLSILIELTKFMEIFHLEGQILVETLELAMSEGLTFYDASYLIFARKFGRILASDDKELLDIGPKYGLEVIKSDDLQ